LSAPGAPLTPLEALAQLAGSDAWLVGGAPRDRLLSRPTSDYDVAVTGDPKMLARALGRAAGGHPFALSEGFGAWRVTAHDHSWQVDVLPLGGGSIVADLARRDLTINALAEPLGGGELVDPFGGRADLEAGRLRMVSAEAFADDPLRTLRVARLACELGFTVDPDTAESARRHAPGLEHVAPERVFAELRRVISSERALDGLELMDSLGVTAVVLPELIGLRGVQQSPHHHLDAHDHTRAVLAETIELERDPSAAFGEHAEAIAALLAEPLASELTRGQALRLGALFHDVAKPRTRAVSADGRITFMGHDVAGAQIAAAALGRLRAGERLIEYVAALTRHHLRLGFLVDQMPLGRRAVYRYMRTCAPVQLDVTVLSVADRLATRGPNTTEAITRHLKLARQLFGEALAWQADPPRPPVRGDDLARSLGIDAGPEIGRLLAELEEASFAGEVSGREQALALARELHARTSGA
jgi:putative nucleotidyltransferase with HDIG domain